MLKLRRPPILILLLVLFTLPAIAKEFNCFLSSKIAQKDRHGQETGTVLIHKYPPILVSSWTRCFWTAVQTADQIADFTEIGNNPNGAPARILYGYIEWSVDDGPLWWGSHGMVNSATVRFRPYPTLGDLRFDYGKSGKLIFKPD